MKTITLADGKIIQVSKEIYCTRAPTVHSNGPSLWRLVGDVFSDTPELGGHNHYADGWRTVINLSNCYDGVARRCGGLKSILVGMHKNELNLFETNPLNMHYENYHA